MGNRIEEGSSESDCIRLPKRGDAALLVQSDSEKDPSSIKDFLLKTIRSRPSLLYNTTVTGIARHRARHRDRQISNEEASITTVESLVNIKAWFMRNPRFGSVVC